MRPSRLIPLLAVLLTAAGCDEPKTTEVVAPPTYTAAAHSHHHMQTIAYAGGSHHHADASASGSNPIPDTETPQQSSHTHTSTPPAPASPAASATTTNPASSAKHTPIGNSPDVAGDHPHATSPGRLPDPAAAQSAAPAHVATADAPTLALTSPSAAHSASSPTPVSPLSGAIETTARSPAVVPPAPSVHPADVANAPVPAARSLTLSSVLNITPATAGDASGAASGVNPAASLPPVSAPPPISRAAALKLIGESKANYIAVRPGAGPVHIWTRLQAMHHIASGKSDSLVVVPLSLVDAHQIDALQHQPSLTIETIIRANTRHDLDVADQKKKELEQVRRNSQSMWLHVFHSLAGDAGDDSSAHHAAP